MTYTTKIKLINAKTEQLSGTTLTMSGSTVFDIDGSGILRYSEHPNFTGSTVYNNPQVLVDKQYVDDRVDGGYQEMIFTNNIMVSIGAGKSFGRYENGQVIPSAGKTPREVIMLAVQEPITPTVSITLNPTNTNTNFGQATKTVNLNINYTINSLGAVSTSAHIEWRRGTSGSWLFLANITNGVSLFSDTFLHTIDDTANRFLATPVEYRLIVIDNQNANNTNNITHVDNGGTNGGFRRTMEQNIENTVTGFQIAATNGLQSYETANSVGNNNGLRERGNVNSNITYTVLSNRTNKQLTRVRLQRNDGSGWQTIRDDSGLAVTSHTVTAHPDITSSSGATNIEYRVVTNDQFVTGDFTIASYASSHGRQVNLRFVTYFGHNLISNESSLTRADILSLHDKRIFLNNPTSLTINNIISGLNGVAFNNAFYTYLIYPSTFGMLNVVDILPALDISGAWLPNTTTIDMNSHYGVSGNFRIYRSADPGGYNDVNVRWSW